MGCGSWLGHSRFWCFFFSCCLVDSHSLVSFLSPTILIFPSVSCYFNIYSTFCLLSLSVYRFVFNAKYFKLVVPCKSVTIFLFQRCLIFRGPSVKVSIRQETRIKHFMLMKLEQWGEKMLSWSNTDEKILVRLDEADSDLWSHQRSFHFELSLQPLLG